MTDNTTDPPAAPVSAAAPTPAQRARRRKLGCGIFAAGLVVLIAAGLVAQRVQQSRARERQEQAARETFAPALNQLAAAATAGTGATAGSATPAGPAAPPLPAYDIDKTMRVLHEIDGALSRQGSLKDYLIYLSRQDYQGVAPEVLEARKGILELLMKLYGRQTEAEDQEALWAFSRYLLPVFTVLSTTEGSAQIQGLFDVQLDRAQARKALDEMTQRVGQRAELRRAIHSLETELVDQLLRHSEVFQRYTKEWDRLCLLRDRAYLAAHAGDWQAARNAAEEAIRLAPYDREAHLLLAWSLLESPRPAQLDLPQGSPPGLAQVPAVLEDYLRRHPASSAPALLLLGIWHEREGRPGEARLSLEQAATYFPRQATELQDMLDPYKARAFLRKSREGGFILDLYKGTMLGAGWFSPELQLARQAFLAGDVAKGRSRVLDHFARRRAQKQWDLILSDLRFCEQLLGEHYRLIFPEDTWLDLLVSDKLIGEELDVKVRNRSNKTLHNATLVLCAQFTDMHPDDYETFAVRTEPSVVAREPTPFDGIEMHLDLHGEQKGIDDVVRLRAILVADEAVVWVDSEEDKLAEAEAFRERRAQRYGQPAATAVPAAPPSAGVWQGLVQSLTQELQTQSSVKGEGATLLGMKRGDVQISLPRLLSVLRPVFRLAQGDTVLTPDENTIDGRAINLTFKGVSGKGAGGPLVVGKDGLKSDGFELQVDTLAGELILNWEKGPDGKLRFGGVRLAEPAAPAPSRP